MLYLCVRSQSHLLRFEAHQIRVLERLKEIGSELLLPWEGRESEAHESSYPIDPSALAAVAVTTIYGPQVRAAAAALPGFLSSNF